jgi:hypothetical protein|tara:strand:+ start:1962 stop:2108 length:147 start_codon:yes stop_codon:yes gene_type:complete
MNRVKVIFENNKYLLEITNDELPGVITRLEVSQNELTSLLGKITKYIK